jgi:hypothetical protein
MVGSVSEDFLTNGLESDRYLKALRLAEQFENEIEAILQQFDQAMVDAQPDLFDTSVDPNLKTNQTPGNGLALHRINHSLTGPDAPEGNQKLNVHLYWMPPAEYDRTDIDGALRAFGYKIKGADPDTDSRVVQQTRAGDWDVDTSDNPYDSNKAFYKPVSSQAQIEETMTTLVDHFDTFGDEYKD